MILVGKLGDFLNAILLEIGDVVLHPLIHFLHGRGTEVLGAASAIRRAVARLLGGFGRVTRRVGRKLGRGIGRHRWAVGSDSDVKVVGRAGEEWGSTSRDVK